MNQPVKNLADAARKLAPHERAQLLDELLISLHVPDTGWNKAWTTEADRRWAQHKSGEIASHDADDVLSEIKERLARRRAR
jgi:hypothetical protein